MKILLVDDETGFRATVKDRLESEGYEVDLASDGITGFNKLIGDCYDLALLDCALPGMQGLEMLGKYRKGGGKKPVIVLTAKCATRDKLEGFRVGADDYVTKPFDFAELLARVKANLRRIHKIDGFVPDIPSFRFGPFELVYRQGTLLKNGTRVALSHQEYKLLSYFTQHRDELVPGDALLQKLWDYGVDVGSNTVYTHVSWLRKLLKTPDRPDGYIRTVRGMGYIFG